MSRYDCDAIVVGSGAAGGFAAKVLTEHGLKVILVEAGPDIDPVRDFPLPPKQSRGHLDRVFEALKGSRIQARALSFSAKNRHLFVDDRDNPYTTGSGQPFNWFRGRQLGGRLHLWARHVLRYSDLEFKAASRDGYGVDWPIAYEELAHYYDDVESFLGLSGNRDNLDQVPDGKYSAPAVEPNAMERDFIELVKSRWSDRPMIAPRTISHNLARIPLPIMAAQASGRLSVRTDSVVDRVTVNSHTGLADGVTFIHRSTKERGNIKGRIVVLCASTMETLRIMLNSQCAGHPEGLGNLHGNLGRNVMDNTKVLLNGPVPADRFDPAGCATLDPYDFGTSHGFYMPNFSNLSHPNPSFIRGYGIQGGIARDQARWFLLSFGSMLPRYENRVTLDRRKKDAWGIPAAEISIQFSDNEMAMIQEQKATLRELVDLAGLQVGRLASDSFSGRVLRRALGGRLFDRSGAFVPGSSAHEVGGAPLGLDPRTSVTNQFNQCWGIPNLVVGDGACFVSTGSQNPTLTIMALASRACDHIATKFKAGELS